MHSYLWWPLLAWLLPLGGALGSRAHLWPWWVGFALCLASALISLWLLQRLPWRDETLEDAVRLVYVAMTRATQRLVILTSGSAGE